ncbi:MAG: Lrp/AsnC ligand binding domain-containing protein [Lentisphaeria bacterium]|nr:Lrp/AsnC ligand binding domain-containing protein [Lentisphaeria bacterium]NQZ69846.1 Lrp/AsnC ligand binding domain-containing protein [Lentisphaeria bacterium]
MVNAFILINIEEKNVRSIAENLLTLEGVAEVYPIAGEYDILCIVRVGDNTKLSRIVTEDIQNQIGIKSTKTLFALEAYSKVNLESLFQSIL